MTHWQPWFVIPIKINQRRWELILYPCVRENPRGNDSTQLWSLFHGSKVGKCVKCWFCLYFDINLAVLLGFYSEYDTILYRSTLQLVCFLEQLLFWLFFEHVFIKGIVLLEVLVRLIMAVVVGSMEATWTNMYEFS